MWIRITSLLSLKSNSLCEGPKVPSELTNISFQPFICYLVHLASANCSPSSSSNIQICLYFRASQLFRCHPALNYNPHTLTKSLFYTLTLYTLILTHYFIPCFTSSSYNFLLILFISPTATRMHALKGHGFLLVY